MIFRWSLSNNKSPLFSRTLLSILDYFSSVEIGMISILPVIFRPPCVFSRFLGTIQVQQLQLVSPSTSGSTVFFRSLAIAKYFSSCLLSFTFTLWSSRQDWVIGLYLKVPVNFMRFIFEDRFWVVRIPPVRMVKFQFLAQFPVDHLSHPVVSGLILFLR